MAFKVGDVVKAIYTGHNGEYVCRQGPIIKFFFITGEKYATIEWKHTPSGKFCAPMSSFRVVKPAPSTSFNLDDYL